MKNLLLATSAIVAVSFAGAASAQSVLERVLGQIDNATNLAPVNGTFANIAENIGGAGSVTVYENTDTGGVLTEAEFNAGLQAAVDTAVGAVAVVAAPDAADYDLTDPADQTAYNTAVTNYETYLAAVETARSGAIAAYSADFDATVVPVAGLAGVDGSISNIVDGITAATQEALAGTDVSAIEFNMPTLDFGDMATTALGAVNTGTITLGVNSAIDEAATSTTRAISATMDQIGGSADTGALVLNIASNMTGVNGSISNVMTEVNGSIGNLSTTALGAVNTGDIVSGVDSAVQGIVGVSGANVASAN